MTFLILTEESKTFELKVEGASAKPVPSLLRGFSAPVKLEHLASSTHYKVYKDVERYIYQDTQNTAVHALISRDLKLNNVHAITFHRLTFDSLRSSWWDG